MASGDIVGVVDQVTYPGTIMATPDVRAGGSTPAESFPVWDFDTTTVEYLDFLCYLKNYASGGLTIDFEIMMSSATTGNIEIEAAIRRRDRSSDDIDVAHTYAYNGSGAVAVPSASGQNKKATVTFINGADMDSLADGEWFILRVRRNTGVASNAAGDMELFGKPIIKET